MVRSRTVVQTARLWVVCLAIVLVCPAFSELAALATSPTVPCSATHACCRRTATTNACPHQTPSAESHHTCSQAVCVLTCTDRHDAVVPVLLVGFVPVLAVQSLASNASDLTPPAAPFACSVITLPLTPPPRSLRSA